MPAIFGSGAQEVGTDRFHIAVKTTLWRETAIDLSSRQPYDINNDYHTHAHSQSLHSTWERSILCSRPPIDRTVGTDPFIPLSVYVCVCRQWKGWSRNHNFIKAPTTCCLSLIHRICILANTCDLWNWLCLQMNLCHNTFRLHQMDHMLRLLLVLQDYCFCAVCISWVE